MPHYRRLWCPGGTYFFTVNLLERGDNDLLVRRIDVLRRVVTEVRRRQPFRLVAWVVLPDHLHCIAVLPPGDADFAGRWRRIKNGFSRALPPTEYRSAVRVRRRERGIWQRRYWEHLIRDDADLHAHIDYIHFNPFKHRLVDRTIDWPHSSFRHYAAQGIYPTDWAGRP